MLGNGRGYSPVNGSTSSGSIGRFVEAVGHVDPKAVLRGTVSNGPDAENRRRNETVEAKWEQLQYYESNQWQQQQQDPSGFSSLASSSATSTTSANSSESDVGTRPKSRLQRMKNQSLKKLGSIRAQLATLTVGKSRTAQTQTTFADLYDIRTDPDGTVKPRGVIPRIRASKSMQNLEQITRDRYHNLRDMSVNIKQKYNSRVELRYSQPTTRYGELSDDDDEDLDDHEKEKLAQRRKTKAHQKYLNDLKKHYELQQTLVKIGLA